ncbi:MAG: AAA family ATPase [Nitrospirae bacterium]|nr:AAA family ATPase [Nitrospirota bacterium]MCL5285823.1 AAA family ATPase [Nitrospirota bacterium]
MLFRPPKPSGKPWIPDPLSPASSLSSLLDHTGTSSAILSGPAGSGKTTLTASFLREAASRGLSLAIAAPTHKALRVLRETLARKGSPAPHLLFTTLHSLLGLRLSENEDGSFSIKPGPGPDLSLFDWIIIDECSLVGKELLDSLERARGRARILFVGDPYQLPPVEALHLDTPPVFSRSYPTLSLDRVHRQTEDHPVHRLTRSLLSWNPDRGRPTPASLFPDFEEMVPRDLSHPGRLLWIPGGSREAVRWAGALSEQGENLRILAYTNRRVELYNRLLYQREYGMVSGPFARHERVLIHETTGIKTGEGELRVLPAGEELTVLEIFPENHPDYPEIPAHRVYVEDESGDGFSVMVPDDSAFHQKTIDGYFRKIRTLKEGSMPARSEISALAKKAWGLKRAFTPLRHGYATTVFKAQGSTFDSVIVDWRDLGLFREDKAFVRALYVAATRPRFRLLFSGPSEV